MPRGNQPPRESNQRRSWLGALPRLTEAAGYTELDDSTHGSPSAGVESQWHPSSADNAPSASWSTGADGAGVALEIKTAL